jgi:cold shock CspA family protein
MAVQQQQRRPIAGHARVQAHAIAVHGAGLKTFEHGRKLNPDFSNNQAIDSFPKGNNWTVPIWNSCSLCASTAAW